MADLNRLQKFVDGKYQPVVEIFSDGCILRAPARKDILISESFTYYSIEQASTHGHAVSVQKHNSQGEIIQHALYVLPDYALRTYIVCDIVKSCVVRGFPFALTKFTREGEDVGQNVLFDVLKPNNFDLNAEILEKEDLIREIFLKGDYNSEERLALVNDSIEDGFRILCNFFLEI